MTAEEMARLRDMAGRARKLAQEMTDRPEGLECLGKGEYTCLTNEVSRPLTHKEKVVYGLVVRPFQFYDVLRLCPNCRAFYHVEMAAQLLHARCVALARTVRQDDMEKGG